MDRELNQILAHYECLIDIHNSSTSQTLGKWKACYCNDVAVIIDSYTKSYSRINWLVLFSLITPFGYGFWGNDKKFG